MDDIHGVWGGYNLKDSLGYEIMYELHEKPFKTTPIPQEYQRYAETREVVITERDDQDMPVAVVFRDSTCDFLIDFLSSHFKRVIYIWHKGDIYREVIEKEKPDIVINFMAERFVSTYPHRKALA